jgi:UDP-glucose 4-epimerase
LTGRNPTPNGEVVAVEATELEVRTMFRQLLAKVAQHAETDADFQSDLEGFNARIQWQLGQTKGWQIFQDGKYSFELDAELEDPDITVKFTDLEVARKLLSGESQDFLVNNFGREIQIQVAQKGFPMMKLSRIPGLKRVFEEFLDLENATGTVIPINESLGNVENQVLPLAVVEHFISKASHIYLMTECPCRTARKCEHHDHSIGCTWMGRGVLKISAPPEKGRLATKEEALERARRALENGLVPTLGRLRGDSFTMGALPDTGHFMSLCYCCPCCCILGTWKHAAKSLRNIFQRLEGVSVEVDAESCDGCGLCTDVCIFDGMRMVDGISVIDQNNCLGCGRCERECPTEAIHITMEDLEGVDKMFARIESYVDVT